MRILFCDDNTEILQQLQKYTFEFFQAHGAKPEFAAYTSGDELLQSEHRADIAFLDVEMPGTSGIYTGAELKRRNPHIKIFIVTAYPDYLDEAMRFQVFRYLSKPIDKNRLFRNLKDALYQYNIESKEFAIDTAEGIFVRRAEEIVYAEAASRKSVIHTINGELFSTRPITYWTETLTLPCFYITHRSFIINMNFVRAIEKDRVQLSYNGHTSWAYLTRRRYTCFKQAYLLYLESTK